MDLQQELHQNPWKPCKLVGFLENVELLNRREPLILRQIGLLTAYMA